MSTATTQAAKLFSDLKTQLDKDAKQGAIAMEQACRGTEFEMHPPTEMTGAARVIAGLITEREQHKNCIKATVGEADAKLANALFDTEHDGATFATLPTILKNQKLAIDTLTAQVRSHVESESRFRATVEQLGFNEIPGLACYFDRPTPLLVCAEAAAVFIHARTDPRVTEKYLRRRGWLMKTIPGSWVDPDSKAVYPLDAAVMVQVKRDTLPFKGLGSVDWKGASNGHVGSGDLAALVQAVRMMSEQVDAMEKRTNPTFRAPESITSHVAGADNAAADLPPLTTHYEVVRTGETMAAVLDEIFDLPHEHGEEH